MPQQHYPCATQGGVIIINFFKEDELMNELKHKREFYTCRRLRLLKYLLDKGFEPEAEVPDPQNYRYKLWLFRNSLELEEALDEYFSQFKKDN